MKAWLPIVPFVAALSLLGCGGNDPVAGNAQAATPAAAVEPMGWVLSDDGSAARFGPANSEAALTVACDRTGASPVLVVIRHHAAPQDGKGTLSLTGSEHVASLPMAASPTTLGPGRWEWRGSAGGDMARALARPFADSGTIEVSLGGTGDLVVPAAAAVRSAFARCGL